MIATATPAPIQSAAPGDSTVRKAALVVFDGDVPPEDPQQQSHKEPDNPDEPNVEELLAPWPPPPLAPPPPFLLVCLEPCLLEGL